MKNFDGGSEIKVPVNLMQGICESHTVAKISAMLAERREQIGQMGINIDLDTTATDIASISFENGINGTMTKNTKKVYPNDLCPCGSGKKFKK